ncbi:DUF2711 family protein [Mucilaginibacter sp.]|uniref:DUF2711 family protein n=1 Tax=Mucilaginibacter sp. TaxID=1882438 RepID=UPI0025FB4918|nr:DUF2711 family protein [Mucilaginibacter sp.]
MAERSKSIAKIAPNIIPPREGAILDHYKDYYDSVYIILHPFSKTKLRDDKKLEKHPTSKGEYVNATQKISWAELLTLSGLPDINRLDIALRNLILGLNKVYSNEEDLRILKESIKKNNLTEPVEGCFSWLLIDDMMAALTALGHEWIYIGDEFGFERKIEFIDDIINDKIELSSGHESWYTTMNEVLVTTHWDSHFTFLCSDRQTIEKILELYPFEGFYCTPETEVYWSIRSKI